METALPAAAREAEASQVSRTQGIERDLLKGLKREAAEPDCGRPQISVRKLRLAIKAALLVYESGNDVDLD